MGASVERATSGGGGACQGPEFRLVEIGVEERGVNDGQDQGGGGADENFIEIEATGDSAGDSFLATSVDVVAETRHETSPSSPVSPVFTARSSGRTRQRHAYGGPSTPAIRQQRLRNDCSYGELAMLDIDDQVDALAEQAASVDVAEGESDSSNIMPHATKATMEYMPKSSADSRPSSISNQGMEQRVATLEATVAQLMQTQALLLQRLELLEDAKESGCIEPASMVTTSKIVGL